MKKIFALLIFIILPSHVMGNCLDFFRSTHKGTIIKAAENILYSSAVNAKLENLKSYYMPRHHVVQKDVEFVLSGAGIHVTLTPDQTEALKVISLSDNELLFANVLPAQEIPASSAKFYATLLQTQNHMRLLRRIMIEKVFPPHIARILVRSHLRAGYAPQKEFVRTADRSRMYHPFEEMIFDRHFAIVFSNEPEPTIPDGAKAYENFNFRLNPAGK